MEKISCRSCWYCTLGFGERDWCRYNETYQEADRKKTRCQHYESREIVENSLKHKCYV